MQISFELAEKIIREDVAPGSLLRVQDYEYEDGFTSPAKYLVIMNIDQDSGRYFYFLTTSNIEAKLKIRRLKPAMVIIEADEIEFRYGKDQKAFGERTLLKTDSLKNNSLLWFINKYANNELKRVGIIKEAARAKVRTAAINSGFLTNTQTAKVVSGL